MIALPEYKLIVAGSRSFNDFALMTRVFIAMCDAEFADHKLSIVSDMSKGAGSTAAHFAKTYDLILYKFPAKAGLGKKANYIRNTQMGDFADGLIVFWDGKSKSTDQLSSYMRQLQKPVYVINYLH